MWKRDVADNVLDAGLMLVIREQSERVKSRIFELLPLAGPPRRVLWLEFLSLFGQCLQVGTLLAHKFIPQVASNRNLQIEMHSLTLQDLSQR